MSIPLPSLNIEILRLQFLEGIPSASGIAARGNHYYVIGDDSPFLFLLDPDLKIISKILIYPLEEGMEGDVFSKPIKPDFEAIEIIGDREILIFGSGSLSPYRNRFIRIPLDDMLAMESYDLSDLYGRLKNSEVLKNEDLNIEALAYHKEYLYLFNRGKNVVFSFVYTDLLNYLKGSIPFPTPRAVPFTLPKINAREAGFSGAATLKENPCIVFTASVENTDNAYDDGEVVGSFIGVIPIVDDRITDSFSAIPIPFSGRALKVESVTLEKELSGKESDLILVTDSDGGDSLAIRCRLTRK